MRRIAIWRQSETKSAYILGSGVLMQAMGRMRIHGVGQYELRQNKEEETEKEMEHGK
jgi:hypothetical protein